MTWSNPAVLDPLVLYLAAGFQNLFDHRTRMVRTTSISNVTEACWFCRILEHHWLGQYSPKVTALVMERLVYPPPGSPESVNHVFYTTQHSPIYVWGYNCSYSLSLLGCTNQNSESSETKIVPFFLFLLSIYRMKVYIYISPKIHMLTFWHSMWWYLELGLLKVD